MTTQLSAIRLHYETMSESRIKLLNTILRNCRCLEHWSSICMSRTPRGIRRHATRYAKTSYGVCKMEKKIIS
jgi:hypothetical protein